MTQRTEIHSAEETRPSSVPIPSSISSPPPQSGLSILRNIALLVLIPVAIVVLIRILLG